MTSTKHDAALFLFDDVGQELHVVTGGGRQAHKVPTALVKGSHVVGLEAASSTPGACMLRAVTREGVEYLHEYDCFGLKQVLFARHTKC
jgi:hypothetical protein